LIGFGKLSDSPREQTALAATAKQKEVAKNAPSALHSDF